MPFAQTAARLQQTVLGWAASGRAVRVAAAVAAVAALALALSYTVFKSRVGDWRVLWGETPLTGIQPLEGFAYTAYTGRPDLSARDGPSAAFVIEDGRLLGWPNARQPEIRTLGNGRFSFSDDAVSLSSSDNSDPRTNGRRYAIAYPLISRPIARGMYAIALGLGGIAAPAVLILLVRVVVASRGTPAARYLARAGQFLRQPPFAFVAAFFLVAFAANRAWVFIDYPIAGVHPDSGSYVTIAEQLGSGEWPRFGARPPVYPLFLRAIFAIAERLMAVVAAQTVFSFVAGMTMVYAVRQWSPSLALPAAGVMALFLFGFVTMEHDTAILSESVYASFLVLGFGCVLAGLRSRHAGWLAAGSTAFALAILTRPAGMFLVVSYLIVLGWLALQRFGRWAIVSFVVPFPLLLLSMSLYNARIERAFAPTTWAEANIAVATFLYWQADPSYPQHINGDIERIQEIIRRRLALTKQDIGLLQRSWDPEALSPLFVQSFNADALNVALAMGNGYDADTRAWMRRISLDSIRKQPTNYLKFVSTMLYNYFKPVPEQDFTVYLRNRVWSFYIARTFSSERGNPFMVRLAKEFADAEPPPLVQITNRDPQVVLDLRDRVRFAPTIGWQVYELTFVLRKFLFERWLWSLAVFAALLGSLVVLVRTRARHEPAFAVFIVAVSALGASLVVSLVEYSQPRYSYPMEWAYGICAVLLPLLLVRHPEESHAFGGVLASERHQ